MSLIRVHSWLMVLICITIHQILLVLRRFLGPLSQ